MVIETMNISGDNDMKTVLYPFTHIQICGWRSHDA